MGEREAARALLGPGLIDIIEAGPVDMLAEEAVEAAVDVLDVDRAASLWSNIEMAVAREGAWLWVQRVAERLLGLAEERRDPSGEPDPRRGVWAAVRATALAAACQVTPGMTTPGSWDLVEQDSLAHPDGRTGYGLRLRALLGRVAAGSSYDRLMLAVIASEMDDPPAHVDSAALSALEVILERVPQDGDLGVVRAVDVGRWAAAWDRRAVTGDAAARAFLHCMRARLLARENERDDANAAFERAEELARSGEPLAGILQWKPPDSVLSRVRAEWLRWRAAVSTTDPVRSVWLQEALADPTTDGRCLAALVVTTHLDRGYLDHVPESLPVHYEEWRPRCALHDAVGPLPVIAARVALARGSATTADAILSETAREAYSTRAADAYTRAVLRARLDLARFLRSREYGALVRAIGPESDDEVTGAQWMLSRLVDPSFGSQIPPEVDPTWKPSLLHRWLRAQSVWTGVSGPPIDAVDSGGDLVTQCHLTLDAIELARIGVQRVPEHSSLLQDIGDVAAREITGAPPLLHRNTAGLLTARAWGVGVARADALDAIPRHRLAEHLLDEGEALALRLPREGASMLVYAGSTFESAGDMAGALVATIRASIAFAHADDRVAAAETLERARTRYERLRSSEPSLPPWDSTAAGDDPSTGGVWSPWLARLERCRAYLASSSDDGAGEVSKIALPIELDLGLRGRDPDDITPVAPPPVESVAPVKSRKTSEIAVILLSVAILGVMGTVASFITRWLMGLLNLSDPGFFGGIGVASVVGLVIGLIVRSIRRAMRSAAYLVGIEVAIAPAEAPGSGTLTWSMRGRGVAAEALLRIVRFVSKVHEPPPAVVTPRSPLRTSGGRRVSRLRVAGRIRIPPDLAGLPWEAAVLHELDPGELRVNARCALFRGLPDATTSAPRKPLSWPRELSVFIDGDLTWGGVIADVWALSDAKTAVDASSARVVHVVGEPTRTSGGWQLRVEAISNSNAHVPQTQSQGGQLFVEAGDPRLLSGALVVVQVTPAGDEVRPDAKQGDALRSFCNEVLLSGAPAVIAVPSLPANEAQSAVAALAHEVSKLRRAPRVDALLDVVDAVRRAVAPPADKSEGSRVEAAFDVCLFSSLDL